MPHDELAESTCVPEPARCIESERAPDAPGQSECGSHGENCGLFKLATKHGGARPGSGPKRKPASDAQPSGFAWYCVETHQRCELTAILYLKRYGFETYLPLCIERPGQIPAPLFPGYLFVAFQRSESGWRTIHAKRGVKRLISSNAETPTPLPDGAMDRLRQIVGTTNVLKIGDALADEQLTIGDTVTIGIGEWSSRPAIVSQVARDRVKVLLQAMGTEIEVELDRTDLRPGT